MNTNEKDAISTSFFIGAILIAVAVLIALITPKEVLDYIEAVKNGA